MALDHLRRFAEATTAGARTPTTLYKVPKLHYVFQNPGILGLSSVESMEKREARSQPLRQRRNLSTCSTPLEPERLCLLNPIPNAS